MPDASKKPDPAEAVMNELYTALGRALSSWSHLESVLGWIFARAMFVNQDHPQGTALAAFWAVESFRGKLNVTDAALRQRFPEDHEILKLWGVIYKRARQKSNNRNDLAHGSVMNFGRPEHTFFVPSFYKGLFTSLPKLSAMLKAGAPVHDGLLLPKVRLTAQQIDHRTQGFNLFTIRLNKFNQRLFEELQKL